MEGGRVQGGRCLFQELRRSPYKPHPISSPAKLVQKSPKIISLDPCKSPLVDYFCWFHTFLMFTPILGEMIQFDEHIFQMGWNHQLVHDFSLEAIVLLRVNNLDPPPGPQDANGKWRFIEMRLPPENGDVIPVVTSQHPGWGVNGSKSNLESTSPLTQPSRTSFKRLGIPLLSRKLGGGFKYFYFHPCLGKWSNLTNIFQMGWNHQLVDFMARKWRNLTGARRWWRSGGIADRR